MLKKAKHRFNSLAITIISAFLILITLIMLLTMFIKQ